MKRLILLAVAALVAFPAAAQMQEAYPSYIQTNGRAEMEITPDEFYLQIVINERDSKGKTMDIMGGKSGIVKDTAGSIKLTIDSRIQLILEWRLSDGAKAVNAGWAAGVCVDPYSGEIVALASYPMLNPNDRKNLSNTDAVRNNALGRVFEPGSIFKPITMSIALETGATSRSTTYKCKGTMKLFDKTMSDVNKRAHGVQNLEQVLMNSCNIGMSLMSMNVPKYQAYGMLRQFGFGYGDLAGQALFTTERGYAMNPDVKYEGIRRGNLFFTYIIGPFLILNPPFTRWFIAHVLGKTGTELAYEEAAMDAYLTRLKEYSDPNTGFTY